MTTDFTLSPLVLGADDLTALSPDARRMVESALTAHGRVLLRGFAVGDTSAFSAAVRALGGDSLAYSERSSPRKQLDKGVYTSTEYTREEEIFFHNENSYQDAWPRWLFFFCQQPPETGGATPLADVRRVTQSIDPAVVEEFRSRGWRHVRNFHPSFGLPWQEVFGTDDRAAVEAYCHAHSIRCAWSPIGELRTEADRSAMHRHPDTGEELWFNHVAFFHWSTLPERVSSVLLELFGRDNLPNDTTFGDGGEIPEGIVAHLRDQYREAASRFDYETGDVLMIDNMHIAHAREPFTGDRSIAVAMTGLHKAQTGAGAGTVPA